jgi:phage host-nuclease inhibitor protein Gam
LPSEGTYNITETVTSTSGGVAMQTATVKWDKTNPSVSITLSAVEGY